MASTTRDLLVARFTATAQEQARTRPEVDLEMAREVFDEAATLLDDALGLDELDDHDVAVVIDALCLDLVAPDPGAAIRARAQAVRDDPGDLHDAEQAWSAYLTTVQLFRI